MWPSSLTDPLLTPYLFDTTFYKNLLEDNKSSFSLSTASSSEDSDASTSSLYSLKMFVGGLPKGVTKVDVLRNFEKYGVADVEQQGLGYSFVIFKNQTFCQKFIQACIPESGDRLFFPFTSDVFSSKGSMVEVKPFKLVDAHYGESFKASNSQKVFVGGLPRQTSAETLAMMLEAKFGAVLEVQIDLDPVNMYPRGTAMVCFKDSKAARKAISDRNLVMKKGRQYRIVELKPFLEVDKPCSSCGFIGAAVFCASCDMTFCDCCWNSRHVNAADHKKLKRGFFYTYRSF